MRIGLTLVAAVLLAGCNGTVKEWRDTAEYPGSADKADGVRVYMPALMKVTQHTTTIVDDKTKAVSNRCTPVVSRQIQARCDYSTPLRLRYDAGWLETYSFGVTLGADGCLLGVNNQSTPLASSIATFIPATITAAAGVAAEAKAPLPPCTGDPAVIKIERCDTPGVCSVE